MIYKYPKTKWSEIAHLFDGHVYFETVIKGTIEERFGEIFVDDLNNPKNAVLKYKMIIAFGGSGEGSNLDEFFTELPDRCYLSCPNDAWRKLVKDNFDDKLTIVDRIKASSKNLDLTHVKKLKENVPPGYEIVKLTDEIIDNFEGKFKQRYSYYYGNYDKLKEMGFGFCALYEGKMVSLAATILPFYKKAFEVQVDTDPDHQRKGLARIVCAHLIEYSLENGYDPHWDAYTPISAELAKKLGYTNPENYQLLMLG